MSRRSKDFQPQGDSWRRPVARKPHVSAEEIIRRAWVKHRADTDMSIYEHSLSSPEKNKEMIARLVQGIKHLGVNRPDQPYDSGEWY